MKEAHTHEGCIEQMVRLFREKLLEENPPTDEAGRIRMDDWELEEHTPEPGVGNMGTGYHGKCEKTLPIFKDTGRIFIICLGLDLRMWTMKKMWKSRLAFPA